METLGAFAVLLLCVTVAFIAHHRNGKGSINS